MDKRLCMGNQALAFGALSAADNVVCGYPGIPCTEVLQTVANEVSKKQLQGIHVEWSTNAKVALEVAAGASFAGARALVSMQQIGLNVAADALLSLTYLGVRGGLVLVVADDPSPISSQTKQDTRMFGAFAKVPVLDPSTPEEAYHMMPYAFELSERYSTPVIVRPTTRICCGSANVNTAYDSGAFTRRTTDFERSDRWTILPAQVHQRHLDICERLDKIALEWTTSPYNYMRDTHASAPSHLGLIAGGVSYAYLNDALVALGNLGALRVAKLGCAFPFPEQFALEFLNGLSEVLVIEELEPVIERELLQLVGAHQLKVKIFGKLTKNTAAIRATGENSLSSVAAQIEDFCDLDFFDRTIDIDDSRFLNDIDDMAGFAVRANINTTAVSAHANIMQNGTALPDRPATLCAGCPHRASFYAVKQALKGEPAIFCSDFGCYTLGNTTPLNMVDTCLCMGAGFSIPQGLSWAIPGVHMLGFVGDATFFASAIEAVSNAVYNQAKVTFCILDNSTTAMTGAQPHPGTGLRMSVDAGGADAQNAQSIPAILRALNVNYVYEVDPFDHKKATECVRKCIYHPNVSAIVFRSPCTNLGKPKAPPIIYSRACTNCKNCIRTIGCPALIATNGKVAIDKSQCFGCNLCVSTCSFGAIMPSVAIQEVRGTQNMPGMKDAPDA